MRNLNKSTIRNYLMGSLKYISIGALLSSTALVASANAQTFQPAYPNFAYFLDNFCTSGNSCTSGSIPVTVNSTQPAVGVVIAAGVDSSVVKTAVSYGRIVGYSYGFPNSTVYWSALSPLFLGSSAWTATQVKNNQVGFAQAILTAAGVNFSKNYFPQNGDATPTQSGGYVFWAQDLEQNVENGDLSGAAAAYVALMWAGRVLLPDMTIIPVPGSYFLKVGTGKNVANQNIQGGNGATWGLNAVVSTKLQNLNLQPSNTTDSIDLMSFMHSIKVNGRPLIDGFLGQQYACSLKTDGTCKSVNADAPPGQFGLDTTVPSDPNLPYALMSAHDNPNQLFSPGTTPPTLNPINNQPETPPWPSSYNGCMPFQAGVYWSNTNQDLFTFNPTQYLTPTATSSTTMPTSSYKAHSRRQNYGSFMLSVQVQGGSAGVNGTVTSTNTSISCSSKNLSGCTQSVGAYQTVTLVATPAPGRKFLYWTGTDSCTGNNPTCSLPVKANTQVGACFQ